MLIDSAWPNKDGDAARQVAVTLILGSMICLRLNHSSSHSSLVAAVHKTSICGITLKAICLVNLRGGFAVGGV